MKKLTSIMAIVLACILSLVGLVACGATATGISVKVGTLADTVTVGDNYDTSTAVIIVSYSDGTTVELTADKVQFSAVDTATAGDTKVTITYQEFSIEYSITVEEEKESTDPADVVVHSLSSNLLNNYIAATGSNSAFIDTEQPLYVGDDNGFHFDAYAISIDDNGDDITCELADIEFDTEVSIMQDGSFVLIADAGEVENYMTINADGTIDFTGDAVGHQFSITITASNPADGVANNAVSFTGEVTVVDGYNVYDALDLSVYCNITGDGWQEFKAGTKVEGVTANSIILQNDISVTDSDIPSFWFWTQEEVDASAELTAAQKNTEFEIVGSMKDFDNGGIYKRKISDGDNFVFYGNYFSININNLSPMVVQSDNSSVASQENGKVMGGHTALIHNEFADDILLSNTTSVVYNSVQASGNGTNDGMSISSGGITFSKSSYVDSTAYNTVISDFCMGYFFVTGRNNSVYNDTTDQDLYNNYSIESCIMTNSFQNFIYSWGGGNILVKDSQMTSSGGPAIFADEVQYDELGLVRSVNIDIINSDIYCPVSGDEPWFKAWEMSTVAAQLKAMGALLAYDQHNGTAADDIPTIICETKGEVTYVNAISIMKLSGGSFDAADISGYTRIFESQEQYDTYYGINCTADTTVIQGLDNDSDPAQIAYGYSTYALQATGGAGYFYITDSDTFAGTSTGVFSQGDYLNIYMPQGGLVLGLY